MTRCRFWHRVILLMVILVFVRNIPIVIHCPYIFVVVEHVQQTLHFYHQFRVVNFCVGIGYKLNASSSKPVTEQGECVANIAKSRWNGCYFDGFIGIVDVQASSKILSSEIFMFSMTSNPFCSNRKETLPFCPKLPPYLSK